MRNVLGTAMVIVAGFIAAASANAATVVFDGNYGGFESVFDTAGTFDDTWTFELSEEGSLSGGIVSANVSALQGITFSSVTFEGQPLQFWSTGTNQFFDLSETFLEAGTYSLLVSGTVGTNGGRYSGEFAFAPLDMGENPGGVPAVPEPISWAMMVGGFGFIGSAMRAQRRQKVSVTFA
jgi:hypothetical protein